MKWLEELPEDVREKVKKNLENYVDKNSGEWVPAGKINEIKGKYSDYDELKLKLESANSKIEGLNKDVETANKSLNQQKLKAKHSEALRKAGAEYPELFLNGELTEDIDIEKIKNEFPKYFAQQKVEGAESGSGNQNPPSKEVLKDTKIKGIFDKQKKTLKDFTNIISLTNKKEE